MNYTKNFSKRVRITFVSPDEIGYSDEIGYWYSILEYKIPYRTLFGFGWLTHKWVKAAYYRIHSISEITEKSNAIFENTFNSRVKDIIERNTSRMKKKDLDDSLSELFNK